MADVKKIATRDSYGNTLKELAAEGHDDIVVLDADLAAATKTGMFRKAYPDRHFDCGIAEGNMMGVAAGLATMGYTPFVSSFAMFAAGRAFEQIRNSIAYPRLNVKIGATHGGISVGEDGASHQCCEDFALMRSLPGMTVICPADDVEARAAVRAAYAMQGPVYLRFGRLAVPVFHDEANYHFELGKGEQLTEGNDIAIIATGENGTGKELVARWLHAKSARSAAPFVEVNCAAIPSELIESELFGHERGAFTSAIKQRKGKFEQADGGTLFMDEIGDMSLAAQAKVLRALQESRISRVGSDKDIEVDVRVIAATNKDLREEIRKGNFREDLYHRIGVIVVRVPALREHAEDIPTLVDHFIRTISAEYGTRPKAIDPDALAVLRQMPWTGNIRELRNVVERLIILSEDRITARDVKEYC